MARLPTPGADNGNWGEILNDYLSQSHKPDGTIKNNSITSSMISSDAVTSAAIADDSIAEAQLNSDVRTKLNAADAVTSVATRTGDVVLTKADVELDAVDNTSDEAKPISTATQTALDTKSPLESPTFTGVVSVPAPTTAASAVTKSYVDSAVSATPAPAASGVTQSGFPLRKPGEKVVVVPQEIAVARANVSDPAGRKIVVLSESWGKPGVLKHIWVACDNSAGNQGFLEQGGVIRIYTDDATTPAVSMSLGDFFCLSNRSDIFSTPRVGRTERGGGGSAYRYLHMPFQKYLRVEVESVISTDSLFYGTADYSTVDSFNDFGSQQLAYTIKGKREASHPVHTPMTICDVDGSGQIESLMVTFNGDAPEDLGVLEGNVSIYIDNEQYPSWSSSGMEDAFNGGWYAMPVGGYPAGRAGNTDANNTGRTMYRFFVDDPIFYSSHVKVVIDAGQPHQGAVTSSTVTFAGYVGLWSDTPVTPNYVAPDTGATIVDDQMSQAAGPLNATDWNQADDRTPMEATGTTFVVPYGSGGANQDVRAARKNVTLPADYWVETRLRITDATHDNQEASLIMLGSTPDPYFGSAVHIILKRDHERSWKITLRDDFGTPLLTYIGAGRDMTNMWVRMALKKQGNVVTGYYSFNDAPAAWIPIGSWEATKTGSAFGVGTWDAGAEFDYLTVRPLVTTTS